MYPEPKTENGYLKDGIAKGSHPLSILSRFSAQDASVLGMECEKKSVVEIRLHLKLDLIQNNINGYVKIGTTFNTPFCICRWNLLTNTTNYYESS